MMNKKTTISVIVPVYNTEKYLPRCIDSILAQTFSDFELLLIDDGSKDNSGAICDEYAAKDERVKVFHKENGGVSSARNVGLDNAQGEWITFADSDDYVTANWLQIFIENKKQSQLVVQGINVIKEGFDYKPREYLRSDRTVCFQELHKLHILGYLVNKLFNRSIILNSKLRLDIHFSFREDEDFVLKYFLYINTVTLTEKTGYNYIMPNLSTKYADVDMFYTSLSMFLSVKRILSEDNPIYTRYLTELTNALFHCLNNSSITKNEKCERIMQYKSCVKYDVFRLEKLSTMTKIIMCMPHKLSFYLLSITHINSSLSFQGRLGPGKINERS